MTTGHRVRRLEGELLSHDVGLGQLEWVDRLRAEGASGSCVIRLFAEHSSSAFVTLTRCGVGAVCVVV